jgi:ABC-type transporter Mla subunit MlaD
MEKSKLDVLDLVINILKEHEKNLDRLLERLDTLIEAFAQIQTRLEILCNTIEKNAR